MAGNKTNAAAKIATAYQKRHLARLAVYQRQVESIIATYTKELASLAGKAVGGTDLGAEPFSFSRFPATTTKLNALLAAYKKKLLATVVNGVTAEWELAQKKNDALADLLFGNRKNLTEEEQRRYYKNTDDALAAFRSRVTAGLKLSDRVWKYTEQYKCEIELGLDCGIRDGVPAARLATELQQYLQYPDKLFRRVRNEHGQLVLSRAARAFHPSAGVYRSSYKNALRLTRTETNIAYRSSDHERVQHLDFVLGINIHLSNNHTCNGEPLHDICDTLAGAYPKEFKFTGWHPQCRCYVTTILMDDDEIDARRAARRAGKPLPESKNKIKDVPEAFKRYVDERREKLESAPNPPYWYRDNPQYVGTEQPQPAAPQQPPHKTALEIAEERHLARTPEMVADIRQRWRDSRIQHDMDDVLPNIKGVFPSGGTDDEKRAWLDAAIRFAFAGNQTLTDLFTKTVATSSGDYLDKFATQRLAGVMEYADQLAQVAADKTYRLVPDDIFLEYRDRLNQIQLLRNGKLKPKYYDYAQFVWQRRCLDGYTNVTKLYKKGVDFSKVSTKMPVELLDDGKWFRGVGSVGSKEFFDLKDRLYIPCVIKRAKSVSFYSPAEAFVELHTSDARYGSEHWRESVIYHEFGHAYADMNGLNGGKDAAKVVDDFAAHLGSIWKETATWGQYYDLQLTNDGSKASYATFGYSGTTADNGRELAKELGVQPIDLWAMICDASDVINAATKGKLKPYGGHSTSYWSTPNAPATETIAHIFETRYAGNAYIQKTFPDLYKAFMEFADKNFR